MFRLRPASRIQPARPRRSRARVLAGVAMSLVALFVVASAAGRRSEQRLVELAPSGPYRVTSTAGPLEIAGGERSVIGLRASWLVRGPRLVDDRLLGAPPGVDISVSCDTRFPCRASSQLALPAGTALEARSDSGPIQVGDFDGDLRAWTTGDDDLVVGPAAGRLWLTTEDGDVVATGLRATEVTVRTTGGAVHLMFRDRPRSVVVEAGGQPVTVELPPGEYAVSVRGSPSAAITVAEAQSADSRIEVDGRGPVRIQHAT